MDIKQIVNQILTKVGILGVMKIASHRSKRRTVLHDLLDNPEDFKLEAFIEHDEIVVRIMRKSPY